MCLPTLMIRRILNLHLRLLDILQKDNNLKVDGVINPESETHKTIKEHLKEKKEEAGAFLDFSKNFIDLQKSNHVDADKYFHCKANYEASKRGWVGRGGLFNF